MNDNNKERKISIELSESVAEGVYSNLAIISHTSSEFVIDFVRMMPGAQSAKVKSRVILTPEHAKRLLVALQDNVSKFENQYGEIRKENSSYTPPFPLNFGGQGEA